MNQARQLLPRLERRLRRAGIPVETTLVIGTGSEADEIVSYAALNGCDLITVARDDRPWYKRWISSSPADSVVRKATVPVLIIGDGTPRVPAERTTPEPHTMLEVFGSASL